MAKKPDDEGPEEGAEGEAPAKSGRKKLVLIGAAAAVLLGGGGGGAYVFLRPKPAPVAQASVKKPVAFMDMREMLVNLAPEPNQDRARFLKFKAALEVADAKSVPDIQPLLPRVEDAFQVFVREMRASDLEGSAGMVRLREELLRRVNIAVHPARVDAVLFKDIVVQ